MNDTATKIAPKFDENGLIAAIAQDFKTREVLMLAWMNEDALRKTLETGQAHYWSRSRQELWHKGATSGAIQQVKEIRIDPDPVTMPQAVRRFFDFCAHRTHGMGRTKNILPFEKAGDNRLAYREAAQHQSPV